MQPRKRATATKVDRPASRSRTNGSERRNAVAPGAQEGVRGPYARGVERRKALLEAVLRIVTRDGVAAVTHRAVAAESESSLRATTYYFATKEDMIREAFRFFCEESLEQIDATSERYLDREVGPGDAVSMIFENVLKEWDNPNTSWVAEFELILAIAREPSFATRFGTLGSSWRFCVDSNSNSCRGRTARAGSGRCAGIFRISWRRSYTATTRRRPRS